ncbi:hypothetical protein ADL21_11415 [Streptomyces albus subsp. albus]|nr:hypothetical protein ADL21_11415 [Streptomyces albus subsp. albus]
MDEGSAALYAAIIGFAAAVIGAAVGGLASWRAARHGANAAVQAAIHQVTGQAANEHAHWLRQERRHLYVRVIQCFEKFLPALRDMFEIARLEIDEGEHWDEVEAATAHITALQNELSALNVEILLMAPEGIREAMHGLVTETLNASAECLHLGSRLGEEWPARLEVEQEQLLNGVADLTAEKKAIFVARCHHDLVGALDV